MDSQLSLQSMLNLVGKLDDTPGEETARERLRQHIKEHIQDLGLLRDYVEECLRNSEPQFNRALQDLVNHLGAFLGFSVEFGRYQGTKDIIGFDGHWESPTGFHLVIEAKTSETFPIKLPVLVNYVEQLISDGVIPDWDHALGVYAVGQPDQETDQLGNAIYMERRTHQLRVISVDSLLSLAEMVSEYNIRHKDVLDVIRPSKARIDPLVDFANRLLVSRIESEKAQEEGPTPGNGVIKPDNGETQTRESYWLVPVGGPGTTPEDTVRVLVGEHRMFAFGEKAAGRKHMKPGDRVCFYAARLGIAAHARIKAGPAKELEGRGFLDDPEQSPWIVHLEDVTLYSEPVVVDATVRSKLDAFRDRDSTKPWSWFVQSNARLSEHDFLKLTGQQ